MYTTLEKKKILVRVAIYSPHFLGEFLAAGGEGGGAGVLLDAELMVGEGAHHVNTHVARRGSGTCTDGRSEGVNAKRKVNARQGWKLKVIN